MAKKKTFDYAESFDEAMNMAKKKTFDYAESFDEAMNAQFPGEGFKTEWNPLRGAHGGYATTRENGKPLTKAQALFGRGLSIGLSVGRLNP